MRFVQFLAEIYFNLKQVYQIHENRGTKISYRDGKRTTISWKISSTLDKRITLGGGRNLRRERVTRLLNWPLIMQIERLPRSRVLACELCVITFIPVGGKCLRRNGEMEDFLSRIPTLERGWKERNPYQSRKSASYRSASDPYTFFPACPLNSLRHFYFGPFIKPSDGNVFSPEGPR